MPIRIESPEAGDFESYCWAMKIEGALLVLAKNKYQERGCLSDVKNLLLDMGVETVKQDLAADALSTGQTSEQLSIILQDPSKRERRKKVAFEIKKRFFLGPNNPDHD